MKFRYVIYDRQGDYLSTTSSQTKAEAAWENGLSVEEEWYEVD